MVSWTYSGVQLGTVGSLIISGLLTEHLGWESVFYFFGVTSCVWFIFWYLFAFDSPAKHPRISEYERIYIESAIGTRRSAQSQAFPWRNAMTSLPVWAICVANFGHNWGFYTLLTNTPSYLSKVLHFSIKSNGFLSALPYFLMAVVMQLSGILADALQKKHILSTTAVRYLINKTCLSDVEGSVSKVRRVFHLVGQVLPAICLIAMSFTQCNVYGAMALLSLAVGTDGISTSGFVVNHVDISPNHAGILKGISNTFGTVPGFLAPFTVGLLTSHESLSEWRGVFFISAGVYLVSAGFYAVFASGELATWETDQAEQDEALLHSHSVPEDE